MFRTAVLSMLVAAVPVLAADEKPEAGAAGGLIAHRLGPWRIAVMTYTFNKFTLMESIRKARAVGAREVETFGWQKIGGDFGDVQFNPGAPADVLDKVKAAAREAGIRIVGFYDHEVGKDEAGARKLLEFCRRMGIEYVVGEPSPELLETLDALAGEYRVRIAIHNHPRDEKKPEYVLWNPEEVMKLVEGRSRWIGCCADTGHWVRSGLDPVESLAKYKGRLVSMHLKDVDKKAADARDVVWGTGVADVRRIMETMKEIRFRGVVSVEYEANMDDNQADVAACIDFFRKHAEELMPRSGAKNEDREREQPRKND